MGTGCVVCGKKKIMARGMCSKHYQANRRAESGDKNYQDLKTQIAEVVRQVFAEEMEKVLKTINLQKSAAPNLHRKKPSSQELDSPLSPDLEQIIDGEVVILGMEIPAPCVRSARWQVLTGWAKKGNLPPDVWSLAHGRSVPWYDPLYHQARKQNRAIEGTSRASSSKKNQELSLEDLNRYTSQISD
jgi:hypothetical protein